MGIAIVCLSRQEFVALRVDDDLVKVQRSFSL
jgi:hypothetical protein